MESIYLKTDTLPTHVIWEGGTDFTLEGKETCFILITVL